MGECCYVISSNGDEEILEMYSKYKRGVWDYVSMNYAF